MSNLEKKIGEIITIDGADRSGKHTQAVLLYERLKREGYFTGLLDFPQYNTLTGKLITEYLAGKYGSKEALGAKLPSVLYANNRFQEKPKIIEGLEKGMIRVFDRYTESNMAFQSAKLPLEERQEYLDWLETFEYEILGLPRSDLVIYLHVPTLISRQLEEKEALETGKKKDIHEEDIEFQKKVVKQYLTLAADRNWKVIECVENDILLPREIIAERVWEAVQPLLKEYNKRQK